jgi:hypothetical protein
VFDLLFVVIGISVLLGLLAHAASCEDINNRVSLETLQRRRQLAAAQENRRPQR